MDVAPPMATPIGTFSDGSWVLEGGPGIPRAARLGRMGWDTVGYLRTESIGAAEILVARRPHRSWYGHEWARTVAPNHVVFAPMPTAAVGGDLLYYTKGDRFEVEAYRPDGTLQTIIRRNVEPSGIQGGDVEHWFDWRISNTDLCRDSAGFRRAFDESPREEFFPVIRALQVDADGNLWVKHYRPDWQEEKRSLWSVFDATGQWMGEVEIPVVVAVFQIGTNYVLGMREDDLGVETVVVFALTKTR